MLVNDACDGAKIIGVECQWNVTAGIRLTAALATPDGVKLDNVVCSNNGAGDTSAGSNDCGIVVDNATGLQISNATCRGNSYKGIRINAGDATVVGFKGRDNGVGDVKCAGAGKIRIIGLESEVTAAVAGFWIGVSLNGSGDVWIEGASLTWTGAVGTKQGIVAEAGSTRLHTNHVRLYGAMLAGVSLGGGADTTFWWRGEDDNFESSGIPVSIIAGARANFGSIQLTANVAVAVNWPGLASTDRVFLSRVAIAGGTGLAPLVTKTAGTGFTLTGAANDTDTYQWKAA